MPLQYPIIANRYWNANGTSVSIVAVRGAVKDWAAYIGSCPHRSASEVDEAEWVRRHGCKLREAEANVMFPHVAGTLKYRP